MQKSKVAALQDELERHQTALREATDGGMTDDELKELTSRVSADTEGEEEGDFNAASTIAIAAAAVGVKLGGGSGSGELVMPSLPLSYRKLPVTSSSAAEQTREAAMTSPMTTGRRSAPSMAVKPLSCYSDANGE